MVAESLAAVAADAVAMAASVDAAEGMAASVDWAAETAAESMAEGAPGAPSRGVRLEVGAEVDSEIGRLRALKEEMAALDDPREQLALLNSARRERRFELAALKRGEAELI